MGVRLDGTDGRTAELDCVAQRGEVTKLRALSMDRIRRSAGGAPG